MSLRITQKKILWIAYPAAITFSGQTNAAELLIKELSQRGWDCRPMPFPPLNRAVKNPFLRYGAYFTRTCQAWFCVLRLIFATQPLVYFSHGQSIASFLRSGLPHWILRTLNPSARIFMALHGNVFMSWEEKSLEMRLFLALLRSSDRITVLGENQKNCLLSLGLTKGHVVVLPNACTLQADSEEEQLQKYASLKSEPDRPLHLLHLSLLIESKGYPEFLESLELLSVRSLPRPIEAVICGPMAFSAYCQRFTTEQSKSTWIEEKIDTINRSQQVKVTWIQGASGEEKQALFRQAELFVFPSMFPVEAQPLVLIEAMASGTAILTSRAGEIPSTVDGTCATLLDKVSVEAIAEVLLQFLSNPKRLSEMGNAGIHRWQTCFTIERYTDNWEALLSSTLDSTDI